MRNPVVVDEREKPSGVPLLLRELGLMVNFRMLDVGDYVVPGYAFERKEAKDFLNHFIRTAFSIRLKGYAKFTKIPF